MKKNIKIDLNIYPKEKILEAISDYKDAAIITMKNNELIIVWDSNEDIDEIFLEFWNYVIWLINE